ncbi:hypothetical protein ACFT2C_14400 [Promicromonospora sp. NPDC057138]|uniref:hypothetical protein n=1 Tax=Promicromonospora sp. NPDC057138 TaxID=3346031 RepID=UPI00363CEA77
MRRDYRPPLTSRRTGCAPVCLERPDVTTLRRSEIPLEALAGLVAYADGERVGPLFVTIEARREAPTLCEGAHVPAGRPPG